MIKSNRPEEKDLEALLKQKNQIKKQTLRKVYFRSGERVNMDEKYRIKGDLLKKSPILISLNRRKSNYESRSRRKKLNGR